MGSATATPSYYFVRFDIAAGTFAGAASTLLLPTRSYISACGEMIWASGAWMYTGFYGPMAQAALTVWDPEMLIEVDTYESGGESGGSTACALVSDPDSRTAALLAYSGGCLLNNYHLALPHLRASGLSFPKSSLKTTGASVLLGLNGSDEVVTSPLGGGGAVTGLLRPPAGTIVADTAPLKFIAGPLNTVPEPGAVEFDGTNFYGTTV